MFELVIPRCISDCFCLCEIIRIFPPGIIIFVVFLLTFCMLGKFEALPSGNWLCGNCLFVDINKLFCWTLQGFVSFSVKLYITCTFYSFQAEISWKL